MDCAARNNIPAFFPMAGPAGIETARAHVAFLFLDVDYAIFLDGHAPDLISAGSGKQTRNIMAGFPSSCSPFPAAPNQVGGGLGGAWRFFLLASSLDQVVEWAHIFP